MLAQKITKQQNLGNLEELYKPILNNQSKQISEVQNTNSKLDESRAELTKINKPKFNIGDRVRIYSHKTKFDKGSKPNWTREIFIISHIKPTDPITYKVKDLNGADIIGSFYSQKLQITKF